MTCTAVTIWPEIPPHGVRLACSLPAGHDGDHAAAEVEQLDDGFDWEEERRRGWVT